MLARESSNSGACQREGREQRCQSLSVHRALLLSPSACLACAAVCRAVLLRIFLSFLLLEWR